MAKYDVTPELADILKSTRIQNHVTSKSVAMHIGKSQSYMSKLEKGEIKTIQEAELTSIFRFIFGNEKGFQEFLETTLSRIYDSLELRFSDKEIEEQLWLQNYDTVLRRIPIPEELVDNLKKRIVSLNISYEELCRRINANEHLSLEINDNAQYPYNEWKAFVINHQIKYHFIKMKISSREIKEIFNKEIKSTNYVTMLAITNYLIKIERNDRVVNVSNEESDIIMHQAIDILNYYRFFSISERNKLRNQINSQSERDRLLSNFDRYNANLLNKIISAFRLFSDLDLMKSNEYLDKFSKNLEWDIGFMMSLISVGFSDLDEISYATKKQMLHDIQNVVKKYSESPNSSAKIDIYD